MNELTIASLNFQDGGYDGTSYERLALLPELLGQAGEVDILLMQEARGYDSDGSALLFEVERLLAPLGPLRGFLTPSVRGMLHTAVFLRWPRIIPARHYTPDTPGAHEDQLGLLHAHVAGLDAPLRLKSMHWPRHSGAARLDEALLLTDHAAPDVPTIVAGDCNSLAPDCPDHETEREPHWIVRPPHKRLHKTLPPNQQGTPVSDRRALTALTRAGFVNAGCAASDITPTVHDYVDDGQGARIDHILLSPFLAPALVAGSYRVWTSELAERASDHRMLSLRLDLDQLTCPYG